MPRAEKLIPLLLLAAVAAAYGGSLHHPFVFDDQYYIVENPQIRSLGQLPALLTENTRPLTSLTFAFNYALGGLDPSGYRLANVGVHLLAALLLYGVVRRSLVAPGSGWQSAESTAWVAGAVAAIWAVHPLQTESVTYIWQRCECLMGLFYLLTLYCVIRSAASAHRIGWSSAAVISCALGMASKEVMVTAPVAILCYDRAFLASSWREVIRRRWGLYAGLAATWLLLALFMSRGTTRGGIWRATWLPGVPDLSPASYLLTQASVIWHYLRLAVWPDRLCLDYRDSWPVARTVLDTPLALLGVGGLLLSTAWAWRRRPALGFLGVWFFLILAPTSSIVPLEDLLFEHRMYLPLAAVAVAVVVAASALLEPLRGRRLLAASTAALAVVAALAALTVQRNLDYQSSLSIWRDTAAKAPGNPRAHYNLGLTLAERGRLEEAMAHFREALRISPDFVPAHNNLGLALAEQGRLEEAMEHYREALRIAPDFVQAHNNLGIALDRRGRREEAMQHYWEALRIQPDLVMVHTNLGISLRASGRIQEALLEYQEAVRIDPGYAAAQNNWGNALLELGRVEEAVAHYREAARIEPGRADFQHNWGFALERAGHRQAAMARFREALRLDPSHRAAAIRLRELEASPE